MHALKIAGLGKAFGGRDVLSDINLELIAGELVAILGASGSGKTTLLRLIAGFERADRGCIELHDQPICAPGVYIPAERRRIGYVAQEGALFPHLSVEGNVLFGLPKQQRIRARAAALLETVGLGSAYLTRAPQELSGGEQQRVALARALAPDPALVLLDEPFSALDASLRVETRRAVAEALAQSGATALLVTHDQSEALSMGHRVGVLRAGRLVQVAAPATLYQQPCDAALAGFVGDAVMLEGHVVDDDIDCQLGRLPLVVRHAPGRALAMLRPEQIVVHRQIMPGSVVAVVTAVVFYGDSASVSLRLEGTAQGVVARVAGQAAPQPGMHVWLQVDGAVMAYDR